MHCCRALNVALAKLSCLKCTLDWLIRRLKSILTSQAPSTPVPNAHGIDFKGVPALRLEILCFSEEKTFWDSILGLKIFNQSRRR